MASLKESQTQATAEKENPFKPSKGPSPNHPRKRVGKTRTDRERHAKAKNQQNKDARASWQNGKTGGKGSSTAFPASACNGKRNRYQWTGKGNETIYADAKKK